MSDSYEHVLIEDQAQWRAWLGANHGTSPGIWLVTWKKASGRSSLAYDAIVEEALAYGWVDSRPRSIDGQRSARLLTPRRPASNWSARNKARVEQRGGKDLAAAGKDPEEQPARRQPVVTGSGSYALLTLVALMGADERKLHFCVLMRCSV